MRKRLVVCCDGTWNKPDQTEGGQPSMTNVTKVALAVAVWDTSVRPPVEQRVYYDTGVGTGRLDRFLGGAFGAGLSKNVQQAYSFLVQNYDPGDASTPPDDLFFFGFSRGAYTARSTVGLIRNSGLLRREYAHKLEEAYALYRRRDDASHPRAIEAELFRKSFSHQPRIHFVGVWDTVGALGIPFETPLISKFNENWRFHDTELSSWVDHAYHALAIDERRKPFRPAVWKQDPENKMKGQVCEQVWFAGVHSSVGGGYADASLSDIALLWMIKKAEGCGLKFDLSQLKSSPAPKYNGELRNSQRWYYWLLGGKFTRRLGRVLDAQQREIPDPTGSQFVASTAIERRDDQACNYAPNNLQDFLSAGGQVKQVP
jgi:uncharacterized protein (DUF2235 family)